ncbi:MAG: hypothetical protein PUD72_05845 [Oscillospiraceae bacterium]|nr:hypothetical protein [Oscillospiraceae bacterium]
MTYWTDAPIEGAFTIPMAICDFLPVLFFFLGGIVIMKDLYNVVSRRTYSLISSGIIMCFVGGAFKALWKFLFCFGINYPFLYTALFPMQGPGFCLFFAGLIFAFIETKKKAVPQTESTNLNVVAMSVTSSLPLLMFQTLGSIGSLIVLAIFAGRMKKTSAIICFITAIISLLGMGYMGATLDASLSWANWAEQGINAFGQLLFFIGAKILHESGYVKGEQNG